MSFLLSLALLRGRLRESFETAAGQLGERRAKPSPGAGSGRGGTFGTPSWLPDEAPPGLAQETHGVVSGGGLVAADARCVRQHTV